MKKVLQENAMEQLGTMTVKEYQHQLRSITEGEAELEREREQRKMNRGGGGEEEEEEGGRSEIEEDDENDEKEEIEGEGEATNGEKQKRLNSPIISSSSSSSSSPSNTQEPTSLSELQSGKIPKGNQNHSNQTIPLLYQETKKAISSQLEMITSCCILSHYLLSLTE